MAVPTFLGLCDPQITSSQLHLVIGAMLHCVTSTKWSDSSPITSFLYLFLVIISFSLDFNYLGGCIMESVPNEVRSA